LPGGSGRFTINFGGADQRDTSQEIPVASVCDVCGKGPGFGHNVPWSKKKTNRRWDPNIQSVRVAAGGGNTKRLQVCTSCIKAGKVARASRV
jgi:large subunit ribosomal protein L28